MNLAQARELRIGDIVEWRGGGPFRGHKAKVTDIIRGPWHSISVEVKFEDLNLEKKASWRLLKIVFPEDFSI